ncbi:MAG: peptide ABC transporter substrate-binding protein [Planctomycetes bacterium]|nr:peptide ABC transporter substrate-binding protein [Planctomycetota bacterium]
MFKSLQLLGAMIIIPLAGFFALFGGQEEERESFVYAEMQSLETLDPAMMTGVAEGRVAQAVFEGLTTYHPETLAPLPGMATSWDVSEDELTYTFHLRNDQVWTCRGYDPANGSAEGFPAGTGDPVVAGDFIFALERVLDPETASQYSYMLYAIKNAINYNTMKMEIEFAEVHRSGSEAVISKADLLAKFPPGGDVDAGDENALREFLKKKATNLPGDALLKADPASNESAAEENSAEEATAEEIAPAAVFDPISWDEHGNLHIRLADDKSLAVKFLKLGLDAPDDYTLVIHLDAVTPYFLDITSFSTWLPVNKKCVDTYGDKWAIVNNIVTNGSYLLAEDFFQNKMVLKRNELYWDKEHVRSESIGVRIIEGESTQVNLYCAGEIDWLNSLPQAQVPVFIAAGRDTAYAGATRPSKDDVPETPEFRNPLDPGLDTNPNYEGFMRTPYLGTYYYRFNVTRRPFATNHENSKEIGRLLRIAFCHAIDKKMLCEDILKGGQIPADTYVPSGMPGYTRPAGIGVEFNTAKARQYLKEARDLGFRDDEMPVLNILYNTSEGHRQIAAFIQDQIKQNLGFDVELQNQEWRVYLDSTQKLDYDLCRAGWIGDYTDPNTFLDMFVTDGGNNNTGWSNELYDKFILTYARDPRRSLADESLRAQLIADCQSQGIDVREIVEDYLAQPTAQKVAQIRMKVFESAETLLMHDVPILPLYFYVSMNTIAYGTHGITGNIRNIVPLKWVWVDRSLYP